MWDKIGYNSACVRDFCEIFAPIWGFSGIRHRMLPIAFFPTDPCYHGNEIWEKIGYNSACVKKFCEIFCTHRGVYGDEPSNAANRNFPRPTPVAMATKFETKLAITRLVLEISARFFASVLDFSEMSHQLMLTEFDPDRPLLP